MAKKILVVDDDDDFRAEFKECLEEYTVIDVTSGEEALKILKKPNDIDLVTLDIKMNGQSGLEILKSIKKIAPKVPIIMITGHSSKDVALESLRGHADDFIEKPVDIENVKNVIENIFEKLNGKNELSELELEDKIEKVKRFIERNIDKSVRLSDAAKAVCLSSKYLSRVFKENTGMRFSEFRLNLAIQKAKDMLIGTACNINQIAFKIGYQNAESFNRLFKKVTGLTPKEYRNKIKTGKRKLIVASIKNK